MDSGQSDSNRMATLSFMDFNVLMTIQRQYETSQKQLILLVQWLIDRGCVQCLTLLQKYHNQKLTHTRRTRRSA